MQALKVFACAVFLTTLSGCEGQIIGPPPPPIPPIPPPPARASWLSYKYPTPCVDCPELRDKVEEQAYYCSIGVTGGSDANGIDPANCAMNQRPLLTLNAWKLANGFPTGATPEAHAVYGNLGDLRIGRDMNCVKSTTGNTAGNIACYVTNYGPAPFLGDPDNPSDPNNKVNIDWLGVDNNFPGLPGAVEDAIRHNAPFATVAMVYNQAAATSQSPNAVTFYVFGGDDNLFFSPGLDGEGFKTNPRMCMACHGGKYNSTTHSVTDAQFLPFDVYYFQYSMQAGYTIDDQQEGFRKLNALVNQTNPEPEIAAFIDGLYHSAVDTPRTVVADDSYVPDDWQGQETLYNSVYRPYCRMCHMASRDRSFLKYADFLRFAPQIEEKVCHSTDMPNAQVPFVRFWQDKIAQERLRQFLTDAGRTALYSCKE